MIALILLVVLAADQLTKFYVRTHFEYGQSLEVWPGLFNLTYIGNTGAAWGMFQGRNIGLVILSLVTVVVMFVFRRSFDTSFPPQKVSVGLVLGGIFGNLIDRILHGHVIDFLDFHWQGYHWPAFNIADSGICVGAFLYIACAFWHPKPRPVEKSDGAPNHPPAPVATEQK